MDPGRQRLSAITWPGVLQGGPGSLQAIDPKLTTPLARLIEAVRLVSHYGGDVPRLKLAIHQGALEIRQSRRALIVLPAPMGRDAPEAVPSVARLVAELATFLWPLPAGVMRRIERELGGHAALRLDPLVEVRHLDPTIAIDTRYATVRNGAQRALYPPQMRHRCFVRASLGGPLHHAQAALRRRGYGLKLWDGYRPQAIQWRCVDPQVIPDPAIRRLFIHPSQGSNHARGCAADVTLMDLRTGQDCVMPTEFDSVSPVAASAAMNGLTREQIRHRQLLQTAMRQAGFYPIPSEWWHFNYRPDRRPEKSRNASDLYVVLDIPFEVLLAPRVSSLLPINDSI